jgi:hypothetical protein
VTRFTSLATDGTALYTVATAPLDGGGTGTRLDKRSSTDGSVVWSATGVLSAEGRALVVTSSSLYAFASGPGFSADIDRRSVTDGSPQTGWPVHVTAAVSAITADESSVYYAGTLTDTDVTPNYQEWYLGSIAANGTNTWAEFYVPRPPSLSYPTGGAAGATAITASADGLWAAGLANVYNSGENDRAWEVVELLPTGAGTKWKQEDLFPAPAASGFPDNDPHDMVVNGPSLYVAGRRSNLNLDAGLKYSLRLDKRHASDGTK